MICLLLSEAQTVRISPFFPALPRRASSGREAAQGPKPGRIIIDSTHLKAHRMAASLLKKDSFIGRTKDELNSKLHAVCDRGGKPLVMLLTEGRMSDHEGARMMLETLPAASAPIADRSYDSDWLREALKTRGTEPRIPPQDASRLHTPQDREPLCQTQGLETYLNPLR